MIFKTKVRTLEWTSQSKLIYLSVYEVSLVDGSKLTCEESYYTTDTLDGGPYLSGEPSTTATCGTVYMRDKMVSYKKVGTLGKDVSWRVLKVSENFE